MQNYYPNDMFAILKEEMYSMPKMFFADDEGRHG